MERRNFFKGAAFAIAGLLTPAIAKPSEPKENETVQDTRAVDLQTIANGPFVSVVDVFKLDVGLFTTVRVKIRGEVYDFNRHGDIGADLADAEDFIRKAGFKHWIKVPSYQPVYKRGTMTLIGRLDRWTNQTSMFPKF